MKQYGAEAVWNASILALGYPATWVSSSKETKAILKQLEKVKHV